MLKSKRILALLTALASAGTLLSLSGTAVSADTEPENDDKITKVLEQLPGEPSIEELDPKYVELITQFGDVNFDHVVGIADAVQLQRFLLGDDIELGNWKNADYNNDGQIDAVDFTLLKQQLAGLKQSGGTLAVGAVDIMTGEPVADVTIHVFATCDGYGYDLGTWKSTADDVAYFTNLPTDDKYEYIIDCDNVPPEYGNEFGNWCQQIHLTFGDKTDLAVNAGMVRNDAERNVKIGMYDWAMEQDCINGMAAPYGIVNIKTKDGTLVYGESGSYEFALPDGDYHVDIRVLPYPVEMIVPGSEIAKEIQERHPDVIFTDKRSGIDFTVKDGKPTEEIRFDFGPKEGASNNITVHCVDSVTREPLAGVQFTLIEAPNSYAKVIETRTTDETGTYTFTGLHRSGYQWDPPYILRLDKVPEGYQDFKFEQVLSFGYVNGYDSEFNLTFTPEEIEAGVSANVINFEDKSLMNDIGAYEIWRIYSEDLNGVDMDEIYQNVKPGEKVALADGKYMAAYWSKEVRDAGYDGVSFLSLRGQQLKDFFDQSHFCGRADTLEFTVKDGKPDHELTFYIKKIDPDENENPLSDEDIAKYRALWGDELIG